MKRRGPNKQNCAWVTSENFGYLFVKRLNVSDLSKGILVFSGQTGIALTHFYDAKLDDQLYVSDKSM